MPRRSASVASEGQRLGVGAGDRAGAAGEVGGRVGNRLQRVQRERRGAGRGERRERVEAGGAAGVADEAQRRRPAADRRGGLADRPVGDAEQHGVGVLGRPRRVVAAGGDHAQAGALGGGGDRAADAARPTTASAGNPASRIEALVLSGESRSSSRIGDTRRLWSFGSWCRRTGVSSTPSRVAACRKSYRQRGAPPARRVTIGSCRSTSFAADRAVSASRRWSTRAPSRPVPRLRRARRERVSRPRRRPSGSSSRRARHARQEAATPKLRERTKADFKARRKARPRAAGGRVSASTAGRAPRGADRALPRGRGLHPLPAARRAARRPSSAPATRTRS